MLYLQKVTYSEMKQMFFKMLIKLIMQSVKFKTSIVVGHGATWGRFEPRAENQKSKIKLNFIFSILS